MAIQLCKGIKHQKLPLVKTELEPKVLPDRPVILQKRTPHQRLRNIDNLH